MVDTNETPMKTRAMNAPARHQNRNRLPTGKMGQVERSSRAGPEALAPPVMAEAQLSGMPAGDMVATPTKARETRVMPSGAMTAALPRRNPGRDGMPAGDMEFGG